MKIVGTALLLALLAPFQAAAQTLTADALLDRITGQTFEMRRMAMRMEMTFQPDGSIAGRGPLGTMTGSWTIERDQLCIELPRMGRRCGGVRAAGDGSLILGDGQRLRALGG